MRNTVSRQLDGLQLIIDTIQMSKEKLALLQNQDFKTIQISFKKEPTPNDCRNFIHFDLERDDNEDLFRMIQEKVISSEERNCHALNQEMQKVMEHLQTMVKEATA